MDATGADTIEIMKEKRTTDAAVLVRCMQEQRDRWERARRSAEARLPAGERLTLTDWIVRTLDEAAQRSSAR